MIKNAAFPKKVPFTIAEQSANNYLGFGLGTPAQDRKIIEYAKAMLVKKEAMKPKPNPYDRLKNVPKLTKKDNMNYEQIKQAAYVDELEKIALSPDTMLRAGVKSVHNAYMKMTPNEIASKSGTFIRDNPLLKAIDYPEARTAFKQVLSGSHGDLQRIKARKLIQTSISATKPIRKMSNNKLSVIRFLKNFKIK